MENQSNIQWYPGHMTKAIRAMREQMKLIDLVIELVDARIPMSSRNPDIDDLAKGKYRILILNKADLADPVSNKAWMEYFRESGVEAMESNARKNQIATQLKGLVSKACAEKIERDKKRGIVGRPIRAMVCGIPNVGKSTLINSISGKASAKTGNKPGITRGNQWIRGAGIELLDTPGILWPKIEDQEAAARLAMVGTIRDQVLQSRELAIRLMELLRDRPGLQEGTACDLEEFAKARGCLQSGGSLDLEKAAGLYLEDFRAGKFGRITLENRGNYE